MVTGSWECTSWTLNRESKYISLSVIWNHLNLWTSHGSENSEIEFLIKFYIDRDPTCTSKYMHGMQPLGWPWSESYKFERLVRLNTEAPHQSSEDSKPRRSAYQAVALCSQLRGHHRSQQQKYVQPSRLKCQSNSSKFLFVIRIEQLNFYIFRTLLYKWKIKWTKRK